MNYFELIKNGDNYQLEIIPKFCVGRSYDAMFMFGGVGISTALSALMNALGRDPVWVSAQYFSHAKPTEIITIKPEIITNGKNAAQARARTFVGEREVLSISAAFGGKNNNQHNIDFQHAIMPNVKSPNECESLDHWQKEDNSLNNYFEMRLANGRYHYGKVLESPDLSGKFGIWIRPKHNIKIDETIIAIIGDFVTPPIGMALGRPALGSSLDNNIRFIKPIDTDWIFCEMEITAVEKTIAHSSMKMFDTNGNLLAIATQSLLLRYVKGLFGS